MQGLTFRNDQDFEEICCYLMGNWVARNMGHDLQFRRYGGNGQKQHGIDIFPTVGSHSVFGQAKFVNHLSSADVTSELIKTNSFPDPISCYVIFTTANRHTSINHHQFHHSQHKRPDGSTFQVHVVYWDEITDISFIPQDVCQRIFPSAFQVARSALTPQQMADSIAALKNIVPTYFRADFLDWLETWDFSCGRIPSVHYDAVDNLCIELNRTEWGMKGVNDFLYAQGRVDLSRSLPAGDDFFSAITDFRDSIYNYIISVRAEDGQGYVTLQGMDGRNATDFPKITGQWRMKAHHLAKMYREKILGQ
ncbi:hypothetical protein [Pseudomonas kurunegalensis]|jgi:hypothetical protein|uniref:hypothetical protein n=1 Tax=Pseudomonas kurunegalensis TaxID=485880 RepID=UPI002117B56E|nr:hypothetical protein [Pseudomonas kurunegalensis]ELE7121162.1 hypothetical protein [Stenotrophomonas maltophilia]